MMQSRQAGLDNSRRCYHMMLARRYGRMFLGKSLVDRGYVTYRTRGCTGIRHQLDTAPHGANSVQDADFFVPSALAQEAIAAPDHVPLVLAFQALRKA